MTTRATGLLVPTGRKDWVDFAKGIAIVLVVLYHSMLFLRSIHFPTGGMGRLKTGLEMFPIPTFLFIAGLYHFRVVDWTLRQTWKRRLFGYLYLYVLWSVLRFVFYILVPNVRSDGAGATATDPVALLGILVWPISSYWFILALFVFTFLLWATRGLPRWAPIAAATLLSLAFSTSVVSVFNVGWDRMAEYLVFFLVGAFFSRRLFDAIHRSGLGVVVASGAVYLLCAGIAAFIPIGSRIPGVVFVGEIGAIVFGATASVRLVQLRPLGFVRYLGARSLQIYLIHVFVIAAGTALVAALPALATFPGAQLIVLAVMVVSVLAVSLMISRLLDRVSWLFVPPRWLARALGAAAPVRASR